jgi:hypothetical protein
MSSGGEVYIFFKITCCWYYYEQCICTY